MGTILAIDPGNIQSGYVVVEHDGEEIRRVLEAGKIENPAVTDMLDRKLYANCIDVAIEMIAGMGMTVGQEVFDTCVWIGRFWEIALRSGGYEPKRIYRREEKLNLCGSLSAKDANIRPSSTATRPVSRISARARRKTPASSTASRRICGRRWPLRPHILTSTSRG